MTRRNTPIHNPIAAWLVIAAITLVGLMATQPAFAEGEQEPPCIPATLNGLYIFDATGYIITPTGSVPKAVVQFLQFNGDGTLTTIGTANVGGNVVASNLHLSGTYTVNEDCTGSRIEGQRHFELFIAPKGATLHMIETDAGNVLAGEVGNRGLFARCSPTDRVRAACHLLTFGARVCICLDLIDPSVAGFC